MKLKISDISIKGEGALLKEAIIRKYGSVEEFVEASKSVKVYYESTVESYLRQKEISSQVFKRNVAMVFGQEYDELAPDTSMQISRYVDMVWDNIKEYRDEEDIQVLEHLRDLCSDFKQTLDKARVNRAIGLYYFYRGQYADAVSYLDTAQSLFLDRYRHKLALICTSDLALVYNYQCRYQKALEKCLEVEELFPRAQNLDDLTIFLHQYRWGIILNNLKKYREAEDKFKLALELAPRKFDRANAILNMGLVYKNQGRNSDALVNYNKALELFEPDDYEHISIAYNNIAEVYKVKKDYDTALCILDKAMSLLENKDTTVIYVIFQTYVQVKAAKGETDIALNKLFNMTKKMQGLFISKKFFLIGIETILKYCDSQSGLLDELRDVLLTTIKGADEADEYVWQLKACLGDVFCKKLI